MRVLHAVECIQVGKEQGRMGEKGLGPRLIRALHSPMKRFTSSPGALPNFM